MGIKPHLLQGPFLSPLAKVAAPPQSRSVPSSSCPHGVYLVLMLSYCVCLFTYCLDTLFPHEDCKSHKSRYVLIICQYTWTFLLVPALVRMMGLQETKQKLTAAAKTPVMCKLKIRFA